MALNGRLEDMNLLEILQIVAFSKKTGTLDVRASRANGSTLHRRLHSMGSRYSLEDQGPLTQELTPVIREGR